MISMDLIEGLPKSQGKDCILVIVDRFTKYNHFLPLAHPFTSFEVAKIFFDNVYKLHGLPDSIVSDRDRIFTTNWPRFSSVWVLATTHRVMIKLNVLTSAWKPFFGVRTCMPFQVDWITTAKFWYNTSSHSGIGCSPFEVLYGYTPKTLWLSSRDMHVSSDVFG